MQVSFAPKAEVWRGRGHPRRQIPDNVRQAADATYKTGQVGRAVIAPNDNPEEVAELKRLLRSYAKSLGRRMRIQHDETELRWEMVDAE